MSSEDHVSIEGTLLMMDDATPHVAIMVQAVIPPSDDKGEPVIAETALSDESGRYQLINLRPGHYQVRCYIPGEYLYFGKDGSTNKGIVLEVKQGKTLSNINFRFPAIKKGTWRHYSSLHGLPRNAVNRIYSDSDGFLWLGTDGSGVSRFDGKEFTNFDHEDGLPSFSAIWSIHQDAEGAMWFGVWGNNGVYRYDGKKFVHFGDGIEGLANAFSVFAINSDSSGAIWFGTFDGAVFRYDGKEFAKFTTVEGFIGGRGYSIHQAPDGMMWFVTAIGISRYDGREFTNFTYRDALVTHSDAFTGFPKDHDGGTWLSVPYAGVFRYDGKDYVNFTASDLLPHRRFISPAGVFMNLMSVQSTPDGTVWLGMWGGGIFRYDKGGFVNFVIQDGLLSNDIKQLYVDPDGVIWVASGSSVGHSERGGLSRYDPTGFVNFNIRDGLPDSPISMLHRSADSMLWISTFGGGVYLYDGREFRGFTTEDGLASNYVTIIQQDHSGVLWFASGGFFMQEGGVSRYDTRARKFLKPLTIKDGLASDTVFSIFAAPDGLVWFGTGAGVSRYDTRTEKFLETLTTQDGLSDNWIMRIFCDADRVMWFLSIPSIDATTVNVTRYDGKEFVKLGSEEGMMLLMKAFHRDEDKVVWTSGWRTGVYRYDGKELAHFTQKDGLADDFVSDAWAITNGFFVTAPGEVVWIGTDSRGVSFYDGVAWSSLDTRDGLAGNTVRTIFQDKDGSLWFGTHEGGLTRYRRTSSKPKAYITSVTIDKTYRDLSAIPPIVAGRRVNIDYNSMDFKTIPEKRQYRCRIKEINPDWGKPTRSDSFDQILDEPGTYTFEVQAIDRDLNYSEPASVKLKVIPDPRNHQITQLKGELAERERAELERVHQELADARQIQQSLLPDRPPEIQGFDIAGMSSPAKEVSGDFYSYLSLGKNTGIVLADVTDKSVKAAMVAAMTDGVLHTAIRERRDVWDSPSRILAEVNTGLQPRLIRGMYTAMSLGIIQPGKKRLIFSNAGMPYPVVKRGNEVWELEVNGVPLGLMDSAEYEDLSVDLEMGDYVIFCSDGVIEAINESDEMYQTDRLLEVVRQADAGISAQGMVDLIVRDVTEYAGNVELSDDVTIVVVRCIE